MPRALRPLLLALPVLAALLATHAVDARTATPLDQAVLRSTLQQTFEQDLAAVLAAAPMGQPVQASTKPTTAPTR